MLTRLTGRLANRVGVRFFLPQLFKLRYTNMGGLDPWIFSQQIDGLKSFSDSAWCGYWNSIAREYEREAEKLLAKDDEDHKRARDLFIKAATYYTVSAFPGDSPQKISTYYKAREVFERANSLFEKPFKRLILNIAGEKVTGYTHFPDGEGKSPLVIITNGLEGTAQEVCIPLIKYLDRGLGAFVMEMPGTYAYKRPMPAASEEIYREVIDYFANHPRVDVQHIAIMGVSFGGYWAARMASTDSRIKKAVISGAPLHHSFKLLSSIGTPEIIVSSLKKVTGARNLASLLLRLHKLSFARNDLYRDIGCPILIINGDKDTLVGTKDSLVLNAKAPRAFLKLYENDDHCAMGHYDEWLNLAVDWLLEAAM